MSQRKIFNPGQLLDEIGISLSDFEEVKKDDIDFFILGKGNFGFAEKMKSKKNSIFYAIKKLDKNKNKNTKNFKRETQISIELDHPNLIKFYGYFEDKENIDKFKYVYKDDKKRKVTETEDKEIYCLVLEFAENGSLKDYLKNYKKNNKTENSFTPIPQEIIIIFLKESLDGLKYLHENNIIHRDISLDNILLGKNNTIKISDFGISAKIKEQNKNENNDDNDYGKDNEQINEKEKKDEKSLFTNFTILGRKDMVPPEIENRGNYDYRFDIYCLGLTFLCLISEKYPIEIIRDENKQYKGKNIHEEYIFKNHYNDYLIKLIKRMLEKDINFRPTSNQCCEELEYIQKIIDNPDDEYAKMYLEKKNKPYIKRAGSENTKKDNHKVFFINENNKPHQPQTTNKTPINSYNNSNSNDFSNPNNTSFNNNNNCINNNNLNNNYNNNYNNNCNTIIYNNNYNIYNNNNHNNYYNNNYNNNNYNYNNYNNVNFNNNYNNNNYSHNFNDNNFNNCYNNINYNNNYNNSNYSNNYNDNNYNNSNNHYYRRHSAYYSYPLAYASYINNQYYDLNQSKLVHENISNNNLVAEFKYDNFRDMQNMVMNLNINNSNNSSIVSALQCLSASLKRYNLEKNLIFVQENYIKDNTFLLNIAHIFEKFSKISQNKQDEIDFTQSIENFCNQAKNLGCSIVSDNNNPFQTLLNFCNYLNKEYGKHKSSYPNNIFWDFKELDILPKNKFNHVYDKINSFTKDLHSPVVDAFYYVLLHLTRCPMCNNVLKADINKEDGISSFISIPGYSFDKISNLVNNYITNQKKSYENYQCDNCEYEGPGKDEIGFLNTPKYLLINIIGEEEEIKNIDDTLDLSKYSLTKIGKKNYKLFCFVTKVNDKFQTYIKNDHNKWCLNTTENALIQIPFSDTSNCIPYIVIYEAEL